MKVICKYPLPLEDSFIIEAPHDFKPLDVQNQHNKITLWAEVDPDSKSVIHQLAIVGTGRPFDLPDTARYIGTVQWHNLVWHVYYLGVE